MKKSLKVGANLVTNKLPKLKSAFESLSKREVFVGIPSDKTSRSDSGAMNNATIGYIAEHGAPEAGIEPRPWLEPGISEAKDKIAAQLKTAAKGQMKGDATVVEQCLNRAGMVAVNSCHKVIEGGLSPALKPATILSRKRARGTKSMRKSEKEYKRLRGEGMSAEEAQASAGIKPYINTRQFFRSITYVIRNR